MLLYTRMDITRYIKRPFIAVLAALTFAVGAAVIAVPPSAPVEAASCVYVQAANYSAVRCPDLYPYRAVRAYADCWVPWQYTYTAYGLWMGQNQTSTAICHNSLFIRGGYLYSYG